MTGIYVRIKRDDKWHNLLIEQLTDEELGEYFKDKTDIEELRRWCVHFSRTIRDNPPKSIKHIEVDVGDRVWCDWTCGKEFTDSPQTGGLYFASKAVCPNCAPDVEAHAKKYKEEKYIKGYCPDGMSFADWVRKCLR